MQEWISLERSIADWVGLERDALVLLAGFVCGLFVPFVSRRPMASVLTWLLVLLIGVAHEAAIALADGTASEAEYWIAGRRLLLFMSLPTALSLVGRFRPRLIAAHTDRRILVPATWDKRAPVVDAVFKPASVDAPTNASAG